MGEERVDIDRNQPLESGISSKGKGMGAIVWNTENGTDEQREKQGGMREGG